MTGTIHHIELYVKDLSVSRKFWEWFLDRLGYSVYQEWNAGFSMRMGTTYLVFVQAEEKYLEVSYHRCRPGLNHLAFTADSIPEIEAIKSELTERNIPLLYEDRYPYAGGKGYYALFFEDPDRMKVELVYTPNRSS